ncbi:MAG: hypothetical protein WCY78_01980, partial [Sphaerochaetaceae bacterium]
MTEKTQDSPQILYGVIVRAPIDAGTILAVNLPNLEANNFLLDAKDFGNNNLISVCQQEIPIFASVVVAYRGEPILALFGPDKEAIKLKAGEVEIDFQITKGESTKTI